MNIVNIDIQKQTATVTLSVDELISLSKALFIQDDESKKAIDHYLQSDLILIKELCKNGYVSDYDIERISVTRATATKLGEEEAMSNNKCKED